MAQARNKISIYQSPVRVMMTSSKNLFLQFCEFNYSRVLVVVSRSPYM